MRNAPRRRASPIAYSIITRPIPCDRWLECTCTDSTCATPEGGKVHIVGYAISEDANSDMLHGTATMTVSDAAGRVVCVGTYNARWVRR